jgi:hypothetical protein
MEASPMDVPSIKGIALQLAVEPIQQLLDSGQLSRQELELQLQPEDLQIIDEKIVVGMWYPVASFTRILALEKDGNRVTQADLVEAGVGAAARLFDSQIYKHFVSTAENWGPRAGHTLVKLASMILTFADWSYDSGPANGNTFTIEVTDARDFPDALRYLVQGVIQVLGERVNDVPVQLTSERPTPDHIIFQGVRGE